ncbi:MAG: ankyrin repeat domain-containing protein [Clostridiales Family XIII bacterium]|jgi:ankyrin repeat protein|nr:ankyrin repeat domain-containing protein [Clostridiales Family XIII bacterium]
MKKPGKIAALMAGGILMINLFAGCGKAAEEAFVSVSEGVNKIRSALLVAETRNDNLEDEKLARAIFLGNVEAALEAVAAGAHVNELDVSDAFMNATFFEKTDKSIRNAVHLAMATDQYALAERLVRLEEVDVNHANPNTGVTLLMSAVNTDETAFDDHAARMRIINILLERGAKVNAVSTEGIMALDTAYMAGSSFMKSNDNDEIIALLKERGAELRPETLRFMLLNEGDNFGYQRLVLEELREAGNTPSIPFILHEAIRGNTEEVAYRARKDGLAALNDEKDEWWRAAYESMTLRHTCATGSPETFRALLDAGFSFGDATNPNVYYTPAKIAAAYGNIEMLRYLEEEWMPGESPEEERWGDFGKTMKDTLAIAVTEGRPETVEYLLGRADADPGVFVYTFYDPWQEWCNALAGAGRNGDIPMLKRLMPRTERHFAMAAFMTAVAYGRTETVRYLMDLGFDPNDTAQEGEGYYSLAANPLCMAVMMNRFDILDMFVEAGADLDSGNNPGDGRPLILATEFGNLEAVKYLVEHGADVNAGADKYDYLPLTAAVLKGRADMLRHLVEHGMDVNLKTAEGNTALNVALNEGSVNIVRYLLEQGADINARGRNGDTPIYRALKVVNPEFVALLLAHDGIDFSIKNDKGESAMDYLEGLKKRKILGAHRGNVGKIIELADAYIAAGRAAGAEPGE